MKVKLPWNSYCSNKFGPRRCTVLPDRQAHHLLLCNLDTFMSSTFIDECNIDFDLFLKVVGQFYLEGRAGRMAHVEINIFANQRLLKSFRGWEELDWRTFTPPGTVVSIGSRSKDHKLCDNNLENALGWLNFESHTFGEKAKKKLNIWNTELCSLILWHSKSSTTAFEYKQVINLWNNRISP